LSEVFTSGRVIHGDIWQNNFIVRKGTQDPVLIDFGQAAFRIYITFGGRDVGSWMAPEGGGSVAADIYSLGGLLLYLATGQFDSKTDRLPKIDDIDQLKKFVVGRMQRKNAALYEANSSRDACAQAVMVARRTSPPFGRILSFLILPPAQIRCVL